MDFSYKYRSESRCQMFNTVTYDCTFNKLQSNSEYLY